MQWNARPACWPLLGQWFAGHGSGQWVGKGLRYWVPNTAGPPRSGLIRWGASALVFKSKMETTLGQQAESARPDQRATACTAWGRGSGPRGHGNETQRRQVGFRVTQCVGGAGLKLEQDPIGQMLLLSSEPGQSTSPPTHNTELCGCPWRSPALVKVTWTVSPRLPLLEAQQLGPGNFSNLFTLGARWFSCRGGSGSWAAIRGAPDHPRPHPQPPWPQQPPTCLLLLAVAPCPAPTEGGLSQFFSRILFFQRSRNGSPVASLALWASRFCLVLTVFCVSI